MSASSIGSKVFSASNISTSDPNLDQTLPSSKPITPAPIIANFFGVSENSSAPALPTIVVPFHGTEGILIGLEPVASTMFFAVTDVFFPFVSVISTSVELINLPLP